MTNTFFIKVSCFSLIALLFLVESCKKDITSEQQEESEITIGAWTDMQKVISVGEGVGRFTSFSKGNKGYVIFANGKFHEIDLTNMEVIELQNFPESGYSNDRFTAIEYENSFYVFSNINTSYYTYSNGNWTSIGTTLPFVYGAYGGYYQGMVVSNTMYILSSAQSISYNFNTDIWETRKPMPVDNREFPNDPYVVYDGYSIAGEAIKGKAYVLKSKGDIMEYDPSTNQWSFITKYPGNYLDKIISFSYGNRIFFGLSYIDHEPTGEEEWFNNKLWSYNIDSQGWKEEEVFPFQLKKGGEFISFFSDGKLYLGHQQYTSSFSMFIFDPSKSK